MTATYKNMPAGEMVQACGADSHKWAVAFAEHHPEGPGVEVMVGWFANAMMTMWDDTNSRITHSDTALADHISQLVRNRDLWIELAAMPEQPQ